MGLLQGSTRGWVKATSGIGGDGLVKADLFDVDLCIMIAAKGDNCNGFKASGTGHGSKEATRRLKVGEWQKDLRPLSGYVETGLVVLPGQQGSACAQVNEISLIIALNDQTHPRRLLRGCVGQIHSDLDESAVVLGTYLTRHVRMDIAVFADEGNLPFGHAAHNSVGEKAPACLRLELKILYHYILSYGSHGS